jgi:hypothetical protein
MPPIESISTPETAEETAEETAFVPPLNDEQKIRLRQLEAIIEKSLASFLVVGRCLLEVKNRRLYREGYGSWRDYCLRRWALSESRGLELCRATEVVDLLTGPGGPGAPDGDAPVPSDVSPAVLRPLTKLRPDLQRECWRLASRLTERPTQFVIAKIVRVVESAIAQGCGGNSRQPERPQPTQSEEVSFLRPIFRLSHIAFPDAELFVAHFAEDSKQAARAFVVCRELEKRCQSICAALTHHFPELARCKGPKALIGPRA